MQAVTHGSSHLSGAALAYPHFPLLGAGNAPFKLEDLHPNCAGTVQALGDPFPAKYLWKKQTGARAGHTLQSSRTEPEVSSVHGPGPAAQLVELSLHLIHALGL